MIYRKSFCLVLSRLVISIRGLGTRARISRGTSEEHRPFDGGWFHLLRWSSPRLSKPHLPATGAFCRGRNGAINAVCFGEFLFRPALKGTHRESACSFLKTTEFMEKTAVTDDHTVTWVESVRIPFVQREHRGNGSKLESKQGFLMIFTSQNLARNKNNEGF